MGHDFIVARQHLLELQVALLELLHRAFKNRQLRHNLAVQVLQVFERREILELIVDLLNLTDVCLVLHLGFDRFDQFYVLLGCLFDFRLGNSSLSKLLFDLEELRLKVIFTQESLLYHRFYGL